MSTSIFDLPTADNPAVSQYQAPVLPQSVPPNQIQPTQNFEPGVINELINGINEAYASGETVLHSRDIPQISNIIDEQVQPNYVPPPEEQYIEEKDVIQAYESKKTVAKNFDSIYNEIQTPLLLSILYFIFQLPIFKKTMFKIFPFMFAKDGNSNIKGYFGFSLLFGIFFYILNKIIIQLNKF